MPPSKLFLLSFSILVIICFTAATTSAQNSSHQRISINDNWQFTKGDPLDAPDLSYNAIKDWILPTGNDFVSDLSKKAVQPEENPGGDVFPLFSQILMIQTGTQ